MVRIGFYSGSFDPVTLGHTDVIVRATKIVDHLIIGIGSNPGKTPLFTAGERIEMLESEIAPLKKYTNTKISIITFHGLAVQAALENKATLIIRGLRDGTDFDYEMQMAGMNNEMEHTIDTVFVAASPKVRHIAANLVRTIALMGGDPTSFVSQEVSKRLLAKRARKAKKALG